MTTPNDRKRQAEAAAEKREKEWSADADWDDPETAAAIANVYDGYLQGWTDADSTPPQQEGEEEMKTSKKDREQLREVAADYTGLGSLGIAPMLVVRLLDDLDTQESELTKLRARVALLEEALGFYGSPESWIIRDKDSWKKSSPRSYGDDEIILNYQHPNRDWVGTIDVGGKRARTALQRSKELGDG